MRKRACRGRFGALVLFRPGSPQATVFVGAKSGVTKGTPTGWRTPMELVIHNVGYRWCSSGPTGASSRRVAIGWRVKSDRPRCTNKMHQAEPKAGSRAATAAGFGQYAAMEFMCIAWVRYQCRNGQARTKGLPALGVGGRAPVREGRRRSPQLTRPATKKIISWRQCM